MSLPSSSASLPSSDPAGPSSTPPPASSSAPPPTSDPVSDPTSSQPPASSDTPTTSATTPTTSSETTTSQPTTSTTLPPVLSTDPGGSVVTITSTRTQSSSPTLSVSPSATQGGGSKGFFENKAAVGATFGIVGVVAIGIIFMLITTTLRRRRARQFDREIAEEAKRAPPAPMFMDDDDDGYAGGYSAYGAGGAHNSDPYAAHPQQQQQYAASDYPQSHNANSDGYPHSQQAMSGEGTPSNYMYPSGYSDLGFSDVSSHGTYSQQPMDGQYNASGGGYGGGAAYAAGAGAGAYEMTGYGHGGHHGGYGAAQQQDWAQHPVQAQQAYVYPGDDHAQPQPQAYLPTSSNAATSDSATLARSRSYGNPSPPPAAAATTLPPHKMPQYADGYVAQYQNNQPHVVDADDSDAYGGVESHHGHVGGAYEYEAEEYAEDEHKPKVLKVANE